MKRIALLMFLLFVAVNSYSQLEIEPTTVTTSDILAAPITDSSCHNYCFTGVCVWLSCGLHGCSIETSIRVRHYNPDLVVSVYDESGTNPWDYAQETFGGIEASSLNALVGSFHNAEPGHGQRTEDNPAGDRSLRYKEATAVGHPWAALQFMSADYFCPSEADAFTPYFSSSLDALSWRLGLAEHLYFHNFLPGRRVVGEGGYFQQWGPVFPRTGFLNQKDDVKAGAVIAQRVGNIVTQDNQPHVYREFDGNNYHRTWLPGELRENNRETGVWQMIAPYEDQQCYAFGENDVYQQRWSAGRESDDESYVYTLWRPYECCGARGAYITTIETEVCL